MPRMEIVERRVGDVTVLTLVGRLVLEEGTDPLREQINRLVQEGRIDVVLDLHGITYMDSSGVGTVVAKFLSLRRRGGDLKLVHPSDRSEHVLEITGLLPIFKPFASVDAAVRSLATEHGLSV